MMDEEILADLPALETERLLLRKITMADSADIFAYASDPEVPKYMPWEPHQSLEDTQVYLAGVMQRYEQGWPGPWGIVHNGDGKLIGSCSFHSWNRDDRRSELGYVLSRAYWGHGYMAEAVRAVIDFGFRALGMNRIQAMCEVPNTGSARVMEKAGMTYEGTLRQYVFEKGSYRDLKIYAILRSEWSGEYDEDHLDRERSAGGKRHPA